MYYKHSENFVTNTEAISNLASLYNAGTLTATNLTATGDIKATGIRISNSAGKNYFNTFDNGQGPTVQVLGSLRTIDLNSDGNINSGNINSAGDIKATGSITADGIIIGKTSITRIPAMSNRDTIANYIMNGKYFSKGDPPGATLHFLTDAGDFNHVMATKISWDKFVISVHPTGYSRNIL
jgi:hypothetical protein